MTSDIEARVKRQLDQLTRYGPSGTALIVGNPKYGGDYFSAGDVHALLLAAETQLQGEQEEHAAWQRQCSMTLGVVADRNKEIVALTLQAQQDAARIRDLEAQLETQRQELQARVGPSVPCVEAIGTTAEPPPDAVAAAERTEQAPSLPRYFVHVTGFDDGTLFIRIDEPEVGFIVNRNYESRYFEATLERCLEKVKRGVWRELTEVQAEQVGHEMALPDPPAQSPNEARTINAVDPVDGESTS